MMNIKDFDSTLLKLDKKNYTKILVFTTLGTLQQKELMIMKIFIM